MAGTVDSRNPSSAADTNSSNALSSNAQGKMVESRKRIEKAKSQSIKILVAAVLTVILVLLIMRLAKKKPSSP